MKVKVPFHQEPFDVKGKFMFLPPKNIKIIGSYLTGTTTRPDTSIDIAVEMPKVKLDSNFTVQCSSNAQRNENMKHRHGMIQMTVYILS